MNRSPILMAGFAAAVAIWALAACEVAAAESGKPNIVLFLVDDMGLMDTSVPMLVDEKGKPKRHPLNDWYRTPNMERLAAIGTRFSNFYSHNVCSPTRVSIMNGQNSARHRTTDYIFPWKNNRLIDTKAFPLAVCQQVPSEWNWAGLKKRDLTLPRLLKQVGHGAGMVVAVEAARRLDDRLLFGEPEAHLKEVAAPGLRVLLGNFLVGDVTLFAVFYLVGEDPVRLENRESHRRWVL